MQMKIYLLVIGLIFFLSLMLICLPQDLWLILVYWNEPSFAKSLYDSFGNMFFTEECFYKSFLLVWLPIKYALLTYAVYSVHGSIRSIKYGWLRATFYFIFSACVFIGSIILYLLKVRGCCMA